MAFSLKQHPANLVEGFSFYEEFPKTSFYYDINTKILYVNLFDKYKNFSTNITETTIRDKFSLKTEIINKIEWSKGYHLRGAWTVPKSSLSPKIVKKIENGYNNSIFYIGDYLGEIEKMGRATGCLRSAEKLLKLIYGEDVF